MKFDPEGATLRFADVEEAERFHLELTALFAAVVRTESTAVADAHEATERSRELLKRYRTVTRALNAIRRAERA